MSALTTILSLIKNVDSDSARSALNSGIPGSFDIIDALFAPATGHKHTGAGTNGPKISGADLEAASIPATALAIASVLDLSNAAAGQIAFPAAQNASADPNTLDDYEEGTWTPSIGGTATYTVQTGTYTKIGNLVFLTGHLTINLVGTGSAGQIGGVPFAAAVHADGSIGFFQTSATNYVSMACYVENASITLTALAAAAAFMATAVFFKNGADIYFSITYRV